MQLSTRSVGHQRAAYLKFGFHSLRHLQRAIRSPEMAEGMRTFLEKREHVGDRQLAVHRAQAVGPGTAPR
jgi:hypothetical protein